MAQLKLNGVYTLKNKVIKAFYECVNSKPHEGEILDSPMVQQLRYLGIIEGNLIIENIRLLALDVVDIVSINHPLIAVIPTTKFELDSNNPTPSSIFEIKLIPAPVFKLLFKLDKEYKDSHITTINGSPNNKDED